MLRALSLTLVLILSLFAGVPTVTAADQNSTDCLPVHSGAESDAADIRAFVTKAENHSQAIRITYDTRTLDGGFDVDLPSDVELVEQKGFSFDESTNRFHYTGGDNPSITYRIGVKGEERQYASEGNWIFAPTPTHTNVDVNIQPRPTGVIGDDFLYVGNYTRYTTSNGCHEINLIVAEQGGLDDPPGKVLEALTYTSAELNVSHRYEHVHIFATPGQAHSDFYGFTTGNEAWVTTTLPPGFSGSHTRWFVHEYIHTRQAFGSIQLNRMSWFNEGLADYYSYKMLLELGMISPERYNRWLDNGSRTEGVLADPDTWDSRQVAYSRGGAFLAVVDAKIQDSGNATLESVVHQINNRGSPGTSVAIQPRLFLKLVEISSTNETAEWANTTLSEKGQFEVDQATVDQSESVSVLLTQLKQRVREKPLAAVSTAFFLGVFVLMLIYEFRRSESEHD